MRLRAFVGLPDGSRLVFGERSATPAEAEALGISLAAELKSRGAAEILAQLLPQPDAESVDESRQLLRLIEAPWGIAMEHDPDAAARIDPFLDLLLNNSCRSLNADVFPRFFPSKRRKRAEVTLDKRLDHCFVEAANEEK